MTTKIRLIITADDFGRIRDNDLAIIKAHQMGIVTSTSIFATHIGLKDLKSLLEIVPGLSTGLHLDFSSGKPAAECAEASTLRDLGGNFRMASLSSKERPLQLPHVSPLDLEIEFLAQINKYISSGLRLSHLDNHRSDIYLAPGLFEVALKLATKYKVPLRSPFDLDFAGRIEQISQSFGQGKSILIASPQHFHQVITG